MQGTFSVDGQDLLQTWERFSITSYEMALKCSIQLSQPLILHNQRGQDARYSVLKPQPNSDGFSPS